MPDHVNAWFERDQEKLRQILERTGLFLWHWDLVDDHVERHGDYGSLGLDPRALPPAPEVFLEHVHPVDRPRVSAAHQHAISTGGQYEYVFWLVRADGELRRVLARGYAVLGAQGSPQHLVGMLVDITAELAAGDRPADMFEHTPEPYLSVDAQLRVSYLNPAAEQVLRQSREAVLGRDIGTVGAGLGVALRRRCEQVLLQRRRVAGETCATRAGSSVDLRAYPDSQGVSVFFRAVGADTDTERPGCPVGDPRRAGPDRAEHRPDCVASPSPAQCRPRRPGRRTRTRPPAGDGCGSLTVGWPARGTREALHRDWPGRGSRSAAPPRTWARRRSQG